MTQMASSYLYYFHIAEFDSWNVPTSLQLIPRGVAFKDSSDNAVNN